MAAAQKFLTGRLALVTGSTSGIGLGVAESLAKAGASLILNGFGAASEIQALTRRLASENGVLVTHLNADLTSAEAIQSLMQTASSLDGHSGVDILVNNAGMQHVAPIEKMPLAMWDKVIALNLTAPFLLTQQALPSMKAKGWGRIVNIASVHAGKAPYVASKHGVVGLTKVTALELAGSGVTCNAVCPGWVLTPLVQAQIDARATTASVTTAQAMAQLLQEKQPSGQFALPSDIGDLVVFLCSKAAGQMTGSSLTVDGGWTSQ